jgi:hypothetical protein
VKHTIGGLSFGTGTRLRFITGLEIRARKLDIPRGCVKRRIMDIAIVDVRRQRRALRKLRYQRLLLQPNFKKFLWVVAQGDRAPCIYAEVVGSRPTHPA